MADRNFNPMQALEKEIKVITGRFNLHTDASVLSSAGIGFSVAKTATGTYTITLQDKYPTLLGASLVKLEAAAGALMPALISEDVDVAKTVVVKTAPTATGTPTDTSAAISIFFTLHLKNRGAGN